jgi:hypothetical protein
VGKTKAHLHERPPSFVVSSFLGRLHHLSQRARVEFICDIANLEALESSGSIHLLDATLVALVTEFVSVAFKEFSTFWSIIVPVI